MDDLFDTVQGSKYFTKLDLHSGYNQDRIRREDIPKTALNTPLGHFQFKVMGFGLCKAPATFQTLMNEAGSSPISEEVCDRFPRRYSEFSRERGTNT